MNARLLIPITAAACTLVVTIGLTRLGRAQTRANAATNRLLIVQQDAQRILDLRAAKATVSLGKRPDADIIARISDTLTAAGIPSNVLGNVGASTDTPVTTPSGPVTHKQRVRFTLQPVNTAQLGRFLEAWQTDQHLWSVTQLELTTTARSTDTSASYAANLTIEATYLAQDTTP